MLYTIINLSKSIVFVPTSFKEALLTPVLKNSQVNKDFLNNYQPRIYIKIAQTRHGPIC